jgi:hypothetical protein
VLSARHEEQIKGFMTGLLVSVRSSWEARLALEGGADVIAHHLANSTSAGRSPPALARGWRAEVVGRVIEDLIAGRLAIRVGDPASEQPLVIEPRGERSP